MNNSNRMLSSGSSQSLAPFNNYDPKQKSSWLCYLCGNSQLPDEELLNIHRKQRINLSKISKTTKQSKKMTTDDQQMQVSSKIVKNSSNRLSLKNSVEPKLLSLILPENESKLLTKNKTSTNIRNIQFSEQSMLESTSHHSQKNVPYQYRHSTDHNHYNRIGSQGNFQPLLQPLTNNQQEKLYYAKSSTNIQSTDSRAMRKSLTFAYSNPIAQPIIQLLNQQKTLKCQPQNLYPSIQSINKSQQSTLWGSKTLKQNNDEKPTNPTNTPTNNQTEDEIPTFDGLKKMISIQEHKQFKLKNKKSMSNNKTPKFMVNMKRVSSRSEAPQLRESCQSDISSGFTQLGNKIKIGIRKVHSINSQESDEDKYSQVLSHGQKSFLMTEINEVEEMSRISSNSRFTKFKLWEDDQKNPEY